MVQGGIGATTIRLLLASAVALALSGHPSANAAPVNAATDAIPEARIRESIDDNRRITLTGNRHPRVMDANDLGRAEDTLRLDRMILSLTPDPSQSAALDAFLVSARDPVSPRYGQWMTAQDFEQHFGISPKDIDAIIRWLTRHGFTIDDIPAGRRAIVFSGTAVQIREAFHTEIHRYQLDGEPHLANAGDPQIPAVLAPVIRGIVSLHDFHSRPLHARTGPIPTFTSGSAHYLAPADYATIYGLKPLLAQSINGSGRSIAILGRSNVVLADIQQFRSVMALAANPPQIIVNGADPGLVSGDQGESDLDLEWAGAVAPGATVKFITSKTTVSTDGIDLSAQYAVSNNAADVISLSYGQCELNMGTAAVNFYGNLWQQAAAQGITVLVSSGDAGAAGCDSPSANRATHGRGVNGLCTSPYSTCVGGTQFADTANPAQYWSSTNNSTDHSSVLSYIPEIVWNESGANGGSGLWASGGGASIFYAKPSWQSTPGVPSDGKRDVPDVALTAAGHDGYLVYSSDNSTQTQTLYGFSGTSAAAPSFAGIIALVNQKTGYRQGNANPTLYALASHQAGGGPAYFHQVTSGNNSVPGVTGFAANSATPHYNQATGLGSMDGNVLVNHWTDLLPASSTTVTASPDPSSVGQSVTLTATVTGSSPSGTVQFADNGANVGAPIALSGGIATYALTTLAAGSHSVTAAYSGDPNNLPSTATAFTQTVITPTSVALSSPAASVAPGQTVTLTATVSGAAPTGTVQFSDNGTNLGPPVALNPGAATLSINTFAVGSHVLKAAYSGDAANTASTSPTVTVTVTQAYSTTSLSSSAPSITQGQSVTFTATVSGASPGGSVQFMDGGVNLGSAALGGGTAAFTTNMLSVGSHSITGIYGGDANNLGSTSAAITETVTAAVVSGAGDADVPTLPEWATLLMGSLLLLIGWRQSRTSGAR